MNKLRLRFFSISATWVMAGGALAADPSCDAVFDAIRNNQVNELRFLVKNRDAANVKDDRGITPLMVAAYAGSAESMKFLLDQGADVNAKNAFDSTALMWSVTDMQKARMLVDRGAEVNAQSKLGRTPVMIAAMNNQSAEVVRFLISKGADLKAVDRGKMTSLAAATHGNDTETIRIMVEAGLDVNAPDSRGFTPFIYAAVNSNTAAVKMMIDKGAKVNHVSASTFVEGLSRSTPALSPLKNGPVDLGNFTALILAAPFGPPELIKTLLDAGADVNAKDVRGMTPLIMALATDYSDPAIVKMLVDKGADPKVKSTLGETALDWGRKFGLTLSLKELTRGAAAINPDPSQVAQSERLLATPQAVVEQSFAMLERTSGEFLAKGGCMACHAQNIADIAAATLRTRGLRVDEKLAAERQKQYRAFYGPMVPNLLEGIDRPGGIGEIVYAVAGLATSGYAPDRMTDALAARVASLQLRDGKWRFRQVVRPPMGGGDITNTALAIYALKTYGTPGRRVEMTERIERAKSWLLAAKPVTAEDRNFQLLGLRWAGAREATLQRLSKAIAANQRPDGGWSQRDELESDAYGTGQTLYALAECGFSTKDPVYGKGVHFLLVTRKEDGSWFVRSRSPKFQPYFESGFPHDHDQWISSMATGWATAALAHVVAPVVEKRAE